jgi:hypothetical protein
MLPVSLFSTTAGKGFLTALNFTRRKRWDTQALVFGRQMSTSAALSAIRLNHRQQWDTL